MGTNAERQDTQKATMFDFRLIIKQSEKTNYTREELLDLIDTFVLKQAQDAE